MTQICQLRVSQITPFLGAIRSGSPSPMQSFANLSSRSNNDIRIEITGMPAGRQ